MRPIHEDDWVTARNKRSLGYVSTLLLFILRLTTLHDTTSLNVVIRLVILPRHITGRGLCVLHHAANMSNSRPIVGFIPNDTSVLVEV